MLNIFIRSSLNPILRPDPDLVWASTMVYNPAVLYEDGLYHLYFRAQGGAWVSRIGYASSADGENFVLSGRHPLLSPETGLEKNGVEDPRVCRIDDTYFLTYTAYDGQCARLSLAVSRDRQSWQRRGDMLPAWDAEAARSFLVPWDTAQHNDIAQKHWHKAGGIFPAKIAGRLRMIFGDRHLWQAVSVDGHSWQADPRPWLSPRRGYFDSSHVEMGPPPLWTEQGWLVLYHGIDHKIVYRLGYLLLDHNDPTRIIKRSTQPIFEPEKAYEINGLVDILPGGLEAMSQMEEAELQKFIQKAKNDHTLPSVIFCNGAVLENNDTVRIFYGAGDAVIGTATARLKDILAID